MIRQDLDQAAIGAMAMIAPFDHQFQFGLERRQVANALPHIVKPFFGDAMDDFACLIGLVLQREKRADSRDLETKLAGGASRYAIGLRYFSFDLSCRGGGHPIQRQLS
jgi:hypothetical protein